MGEEVIIVEKKCYLCGKELIEDKEGQFFPEDDTYICKDCLCKDSEQNKRDNCCSK